MSDTKYNPADKGKEFNEDATIDFKDISVQEKQDAQDRLDALITDVRKTLGD
ncbi:MAG: hypothetical protein JWQ71_985 [Pedosphaera sp.]|nr:hypothetical protein [Pedosphaera sp.]